MKIITNKNLSTKFALILVFNITIIISLFTGFILAENTYSLKKELQKRLHETAGVAKTGLSTALWQFNSQYAQDFTRSLFLSEDIVYVKVSYQGRTIAEKSGEKYGTKNFNFFKSSDSFLVTSEDIFYDNYKVGSIQIALSKHLLKKTLFTGAKSTIILIFLVISVILVSTFLMTRKYLFSQVLKMQESMKQVSEGNLDTKFDTGLKDEIGELSRDIDSMLENLKKVTASKNELNHEIYERKKTEKALRESEERFREFVETTDNLVTRIDHNGRFIYVNPVAEMVVGLSQEKLKNRRALDFTHKDDRKEAYKWFYDAVSRNLTISYTENRQVNIKTGEVSHWLWTGRFFYKNGKFSGLNCIGHDVTKLKSAEKERAVLETKLRQSQKIEAIGTLAGGIAHDFNNILGIILGNSELALHYIKEDQKAKEKISEVITATNRAKDVVAQLLSFSRKTEMKKIVLKPDILIKESAKLLRASIENSIAIKLDIAPFLKSMKAEPTQIHQVIINLCTNAAHSMEHKGGTITISLANKDIKEKKNDYSNITPAEYIELKVSDTGHGIPDSIKDKIFDPYFTTKPTGKGSGLGLSVIHGIVQSHKGALNIKSVENQGTEVSIIFPAYNGEPEEKNKELSHESGGDENILLVDDEKSLLMITKEFLNSQGYKTDSFTSPLAALEAFKAAPEKYDIVITDMTMPEMYGDQLITEISKIRENIPVILCSGYSDKAEKENITQTGLTAYLEKPINNNQFSKIIRSLLAQKKKNSDLN